MSWIERLQETYQNCGSSLPPISHTTQQAHVEIVVDGSGSFRRASVVSKEDCTTLVPCTEESGGRSGKKPVNHPLCDKLQYVAGDFLDFAGEVTSGFADDAGEPHRAYLADLAAWTASSNGHPKLNAILAYVKKGRVVRDLVDQRILPVDAQRKLLKEWLGDKKEAPLVFKVVADPQDAFIRWRVEGQGLSSAVWDDGGLISAWIAHHASQQTKRGLCMVTGESDAVLAEQHPSKLRNAGDKAKLISSNDSSGYTFRGRFHEGDEACSVGFESTQKAHIALRWLIARQGYRNGDQVIVSWAVTGKKIPDPFADSFELFGGRPPVEGAHQRQGDSGQAFGRRLTQLIAGYRSELGPTTSIVVMGLDSATPGRMAVTFYRELTGSDFLDRLQRWHESYAWQQNFANDRRFVGAPSPRDIAEAAFGQRLDDKLRKATVERLLPCIVDGRPLPRDLATSVARRVCNRAGLDRWEWEKNLGIACALFSGSLRERKYQMSLETDRTSRDYLYGRLLAIAEHLEGRALYVAGEQRDTTAAKLMQRFADHPASTWRSIELALAPSKSRLRTRRPAFLHGLEKLIDEVIGAFQEDDFLNDRKLSAEFLLGYHCQRRALTLPRPEEPEAGKEDEAA